jgi:hypothetical protein
MNNLKHRIALSFVICCLMLASFTVAQAQDREGTATEVATTAATAKTVEVNHEVQLYLLVASNKADGKSNVPQALDPIIKQLKSSLPFADYRLTTTFFNRVRDKGNLRVSGIVGGSIFTAPASAAPTFYQLTLTNVKLVTDAGGQQFVQISRFEFGQRVPVQTSATRNESGAGFPVINYEQIGIATEVSLREAVPTIIGIMPTGQPDESFILVASVKRVASR